MAASLLVLTDFRQPAARALDYAAALAGVLEAPLVVLHVCAPGILDSELLTAPQPRRSPDVAARALACLTEDLPVPAVTEVQQGRVAEAVTGALRQHQPALLVLGRPRHEELPDELATTTALELLPTTTRPMLVVPEQAVVGLPRRVLLALDNEPYELPESALVVDRLLNPLHARLTVLHVGAGPAEEAARPAEEAAALLGLSPELPLKTRTLRHAWPADAILAAAGSGEFDLVILLARRRSVLGHLFHHSVTAQVLLHSPVPVLVLPAQ
ncbi:universal stress protein [Hymenobacter chitinivorans]|uniref:Nucleotide-binding universal stress UspA family protein n=1 Tax=Hymenobacter chitinivorans DSM 11115 TaxID=1121954 RepID=A0A2M9BPK6_9BACT|nr:universal stress protein [Hymenobacter chitinivorans]PJJ59891.1 nucleotide-binding universal stress UspA family protein [Hymenobacter chitinivorans DSM 11115]